MQVRLQAEQFLLQRMVGEGCEMIVGARRDPSFGPVVLLGLGGIYAEILDDVSLRVAPLLPFDVAEMIAEVRGSRLSQSVRGRHPLDVAALGETLLAVSRLMLERPEIQELDLNPLFVLRDGIMAADARIVTV